MYCICWLWLMAACFLGCYVIFLSLLWAHGSWSFIWETLCPGFKVLSFGKFLHFLFPDVSEALTTVGHLKCSAWNFSGLHRVHESQIYVKTSLWLRILWENFFFPPCRMKAQCLTISPEGRNEALKTLRSYSYTKS